MKEKTLAARMAHMKTRPGSGEEPARIWRNFPRKLPKGMKIVYVKHMDEVVREAFVS